MVASQKFAEVVFNLPLDRAFTYAVPPELSATLARGTRVIVPFGRRRLVGFVSALRDATRVPDPRPISRALDDAPVLTDELWSLAHWLTDRTICTLGQACAAIVPTSLRLTPSAIPEPTSPLLEPALTLTPAQQRAFDTIAPDLDATRHRIFLLHGVTSSGKTEIYLQLAARALTQGRGAICLVPEIALTPQAIDRFTKRFGQSVALWHSGMSDRERAASWRAVRDGRCRIVIGTRSAIFAPVQRLGLIVLDEEHDASYKQDEMPRYHARDAAIARAAAANAVVILGSATPSIDSYARAKSGAYQLLELPERIHGRPMPSVDIIDLREVFRRARRLGALSDRLMLELHRAIEQGGQAILMLNRRGFARTIQCPACGALLRCPNCDVPMVYHARQKQLLCHYCNTKREPVDICPACDKGYLKYRGAGTERIESELAREFSGVEVGRLDSDAASRRGAHQEFYEALTARRITVLVGTQLVAKGWDLPAVTLVGVVSADTSLNLPSYLAGERTFQLLSQVAGRAGRGDVPGRVLIQTYCPEHYAIRAAAAHDYKTFFETELAMRREMRLPPAVELIELSAQGKTRERVRAAATRVAASLRKRLAGVKGTEVLGPAPYRVEKVRGQYRWRVLVKAADLAPVLTVLRDILHRRGRKHGAFLSVDVNPQDGD